MIRRMLINAQTPEELRLAIVTDSTLDTYQVEAAEGGLTRGNIYRGIIANIQPSLNASFIDYGAERNGFLAIQDVVEDAWYRQPKKKGQRPKIEEVLDKGKPIVVQVTREPEAQKGGALTTNLSLAGRYLVLTPFDDTRGVSRKVENEEDRKRLKSLAGQLKVPKGCGVIVRTNALDQTKTTLNRDLAALLRLWKQVQDEARKGKSTRLLYSDQDLVLQALRDYLDSSIAEVLVDSDEAYEKAQDYMRAFLPRGKTKLVRYKERTPLFSKFNLEPQIDRIYERRVELPSGGSIVIDRTEALTSIDVNSGRSTRSASQEETAVHTNLEAAQEAARQLRLRDIGGLLVVDFIDMRSPKSRRRIEKALRDAMKDDKARVRVGRISANGLLEINRQRIHQALSLRTHRPCPTCDGTGRIASSEMVGLSLLRRVEARAATGTLQKVRIALHPELADAFQNGRRGEIAGLEREFDIKVEVIAASHLHRPEQEVDWFSRPRSSQKSPADSQPAEPTVRVTDVTSTGPPAKDDSGDTRRKRPRRRSSQKKPAATKETPSRETQKAEDEKAASKKTTGRKTTGRKATGRKTATRKTTTRKTDDKAETAQEPQAEATAPKKTTRRRSRRRKPSESSQPQQAAQEAPQQTAKGKPKDAAKDSAQQAGDEAGGAPTGRRRPRRRRTSRSQQEAKGQDAKGTASDGSNGGAKSGAPSGADTADSKPGTGQDEGSGRRRPRRRRSRRRSEDAAAEA